jgi:hypothetical protein
VTWIDAQKPTTLMLFDGCELTEPLILGKERILQRQDRHNRRGEVATYLEAVIYRIHSWPSPGEHEALFERRNTAAMDMLALACRLYSR